MRLVLIGTRSALLAGTTEATDGAVSSEVVKVERNSGASASPTASRMPLVATTL
jgi:hypothetical protein